MSTRPGPIPSPKSPSTVTDPAISSITSYEDGVDDSDGPLWFDAMNAASVQWEAEGTTPIDEQHRPGNHHHHECASPVERVKHEEDAFMAEAVAAMWDSEGHFPEVRCKRRHSLLSKSEVSAKNQKGQTQKGEVMAEVCKTAEAGQAIKQQCCDRSLPAEHVDGIAVQVSRGAW